MFLIFVRHFSEYIQAGRFDWALGTGQRYLDQLIVVPFLFFSGYSFYVQYRRNSGYVKKLPAKIFALWRIFVITVVAYLFGILYARNETRILSRFRDKKIYRTAVILGLAALAVVPFHKGYFIVFECCVTALCGLLIAFSMSFRMDSPVFAYLNRYALEIYLVQRIPMILLAGRVNANLLYFVLCALVTIPLAMLWKIIYSYLST